MAKVLFLKNIRGVAQVGDVKEVARGYARNYLLPKSLAVLATQEALKRVDNLKKQRQVMSAEEETATRNMAEKLKTFILEIQRAASPEGTLYDGLDSAEISHYLKRGGLNLEPEQIKLNEHIKKIGSHEIPIHLGHDLDAKLVVNITSLE